MGYQKLSDQEAARIVNSNKLEDAIATVNHMVAYSVEMAPAHAEKAENVARKFAEFATKEWTGNQSLPKTGKEWVAAAMKDGMKL